MKPGDPKDRQAETEPVAEEGDLNGSSEDFKRKFDIDIFRDWCKQCGICAAFCPRHCIRLDEEGSPVIEDPDRCTGCGWCEIHCPDFAISVRPRKSEKTPPED